MTKKILFICTGNICRSPTAEAIAKHQAKVLGIENNFIFDSAGIESYHAGEASDARSARIGKERGISFDGIFSRKITAQDFEKFDLIMAMDRGHYRNLLKIAPKQHQEKVKLFLQFCESKNPWNDEVIDPYYKGEDAFNMVFDVIESALARMFQNSSQG